MLSRDSTLLLLTDLQPEVIAASRTVPASLLARTAGVACRIAESLAIPVFASVIPLGPAAPSAIEQLAGAITRPRRFAGAFDDPGTREAIASLSRRTIALGGISTEVAVLHTALGALRDGFAVHVLVDCCSGLSDRTEQAAFRQIEAAGGHLTSVASFFTALVNDLGSEDGRRVLGSLRDLMGG